MYEQEIPLHHTSDYQSSRLVQPVSAPDAEELGAGDMADVGGAVFVVGSALVLGFAIRRTIRSAACERQRAAFNRLPRSLQMAVLAVVVAGVVIGGGKPGMDSTFSFMDMEQIPESVSVQEVQGVSFSANDIALGKVLSGVSIGGDFDLSAPTNAVVHRPWLLRGAAEDGFWTGLQPPFPLGTNVYDAVYVSSSGTLSFGRRKGSPTARPMPDGSDIAFLAPLQTVLGIPPQARWDLITNGVVQMPIHVLTVSMRKSALEAFLAIRSNSATLPDDREAMKALAQKHATDQMSESKRLGGAIDAISVWDFWKASLP